MRLVIARIGERLPRGWADVFRQLGLFALADVCYETVRGVADGQQTAAFMHGQQVIDFERSTHTFFEPSLQAVFLPVQWMIDLANQIYVNSQFAVTIAFLVWLYLFRNDAFYFVRNMFMAAMALALVGYTLFPTAPPRLYPQYGFVDTITDFSGINHDSALVKVFINPYAAVPSMHCAFAMMIGVSGVRVSRHWFTKAFWARLAAARRLGSGRHRQPLLDRRGARLDGRRGLRLPRLQAGPDAARGLGLALVAARGRGLAALAAPRRII